MRRKVSFKKPYVRKGRYQRRKYKTQGRVAYRVDYPVQNLTAHALKDDADFKKLFALKFLNTAPLGSMGGYLVNQQVMTEWMNKIRLEEGIPRTSHVLKGVKFSVASTTQAEASLPIWIALKKKNADGFIVKSRTVKNKIYVRLGKDAGEFDFINKLMIATPAIMCPIKLRFYFKHKPTGYADAAAVSDVPMGNS